MKKYSLCLIILLLSSGTVLGQGSPKPFNLYLQGGASVPQDDFKDMYNYGYHLGGGLGFSLIPRVELVGRGSYHKFSLESLERVVENQGSISVSGGDLTMIMYGAELKLNLGVLTTNPYVLGGYGWAKFDFEDVTTNIFGIEETYIIQSHTENYMVIGGGLEFTRTFIEGRYYTFMEDIVEKTNTRLITVSLGLKI